MTVTLHIHRPSVWIKSVKFRPRAALCAKFPIHVKFTISPMLSVRASAFAECTFVITIIYCTLCVLQLWGSSSNERIVDGCKNTAHRVWEGRKKEIQCKRLSGITPTCKSSRDRWKKKCCLGIGSLQSCECRVGSQTTPPASPASADFQT